MYRKFDDKKNKESEVHVFDELVPTKKLIHPKLRGYFEYEMSRITFQSKLDLKFFEAVQQNNAQTLEKLIHEGHSPNRLFKKETIRLITPDRLTRVDFDSFKSDVKAYESIKDASQKISFLEKIQDTKSLMSLALEKRAYDIVDTLMKSGTDLSLKDEKFRLLSDYKERFDTESITNSRENYLNVITSERSSSSLVGTLVEKNDMVSMKLLVENLKAQIDFNSPRIQKKEVITVRELLNNESPQNIKEELNLTKMPLEVAVENRNMQMAHYLKDHGADIKLMSMDSRKAFRKLEREFEQTRSERDYKTTLGNDTKNIKNKDRTI
jgi:hypothetical protein